MIRCGCSCQKLLATIQTPGWGRRKKEKKGIGMWWHYIQHHHLRRLCASLQRWKEFTERSLVVKEKMAFSNRMKTIAAFLHDPATKCFLLHPSHSSWITNFKIYLCFGSQITQKWRQFRSVDDYGIHILEFLEYYNLLC